MGEVLDLWVEKRRCGGGDVFIGVEIAQGNFARVHILRKLNNWKYCDRAKEA